MRIKMLTTAVGPNLKLQEGKTYDVSEEQGKSLVAGGYAAEVTVVAETATVAAPEQATVTPQRKNASTPKGRTGS